MLKIEEYEELMVCMDYEVIRTEVGYLNCDIYTREQESEGSGYYGDDDDYVDEYMEQQKKFSEDLMNRIEELKKL